MFSSFSSFVRLIFKTADFYHFGRFDHPKFFDYLDRFDHSFFVVLELLSNFKGYTPEGRFYIGI